MRFKLILQGERILSDLAEFYMYNSPALRLICGKIIEYMRLSSIARKTHLKIDLLEPSDKNNSARSGMAY